MARLTKSQAKKQVAITDWEIYRKKYNLKKKDKIFICKEHYHFKKALKDRGWHENTEYNSPIFHMKITVKARDIYKLQRGTAAYLSGDAGYELKDFQKVNHFANRSSITTKVGLTESLKSLHLWNNSTTMDSIYPKCFTLHRNDHTATKDMSNDLEDRTYNFDMFTQEFRVVWAESILKKFIAKGVNEEPNVKLYVALNVTEKRLLSFDEELETFGEVSGQGYCSNAEWSILQMSKKELNKEVDSLTSKPWLKLIT